MLKTVKLKSIPKSAIVRFQERHEELSPSTLSCKHYSDKINLRSQHSPLARLLSELTAQSPYVPEMVVRNQRLSPCRCRVLNSSGGRRQPPRSTPDEKVGMFLTSFPQPLRADGTVPRCAMRLIPRYFTSNLIGGAWEVLTPCLEYDSTFIKRLSHPEQGKMSKRVRRFP